MPTLAKMHQIQETITANDVIFCYSGYMTEDVLLSLGSTIRQKLEIVQADRQVARTVFAIFVEEMQNVIRYSKAVLPEVPEHDDSEAILRHGFLAVGKEGERYFVCCGNMVLSNDVDRLRGHLDQIKKLDQTELKALYKEILKDEVPEGSKGAGVGFVDIARRAKGDFDYTFEPVNDDRAYFYLRAYA